MDDIWINFYVWNKTANKISWIMFISSRICMNFLHDHSSIEDSWMISHKCSSIKYEYILLNYFVTSLYLLPNSTLPNGEVQVTIWLFCEIEFAGLSNPLCQITESTVPNCRIHVAKSAFPSYQFHTTKATLPNCQVQICFVNCPPTA